MITPQHKQSSLVYLLITYFVLLSLYSIWTYSLTDPNLTLISWPPYQSFQNWMWRSFFHNRTLLSTSFSVIILALFTNYLLLVRKLKEIKLELTTKSLLNWKKPCLVFLLLVAPLLISYNSLSHDVFNYIFNAKMVAFYQANPHIQTALDFARDDWTRFMHNVHTPAPYGYGWTVFSILPYLLGFNKFFLSWMIFRLLSLSSIGLLFLCLRWLALKLKLSVRLYQLAFLFLNPLFLIEIISNSHNDLWMLLPAMLSLGLVSTTRSTRLSPKTTLISITLMALSISIKLATVILIPVWLVLFAKNNLLLNKINQTKLPSLLKTSLVWLSGGLSKLLNLWWPLAASLLMFLPLMTARSKQFLPWYLVWALVWLPLIRWKPWKYLLLIFSISSLFRYLPWMLAGNFDGDVITHQKLITWLIPAAIFFIWLLKKSFQKSDSPIPLEGKSI